MKTDEKVSSVNIEIDLASKFSFERQVILKFLKFWNVSEKNLGYHVLRDSEWSLTTFISIFVDTLEIGFEVDLLLDVQMSYEKHPLFVQQFIFVSKSHDFFISKLLSSFKRIEKSSSELRMDFGLVFLNIFRWKLHEFIKDINNFIPYCGCMFVSC